MEPTNFSENSPGRLVELPEGAWAFVPHPLPPPLELSWELMNALDQARAGVGELEGVASRLPNPHWLIPPLVRREAVLSSRIEGIETTVESMLCAEATNRYGAVASTVREVQNYVEAIEYGLSNALPMSKRLMREMHEILMQHVRGSHQTPGDFRRSQNYIAAPGRTLESASFIPPPPNEIEAAMDALERYIHGPEDVPALIRLALIHYQVEAIHPFLDGNGRIGRLMLVIVLCQWQLLSQPLLYLSAYFERNRAEYYRLLLAVSHKGAWEDWVLFFLRGVAEQSADAIARSNALMGTVREYRERLQSGRTSASVLRLVDSLTASPFITISQAADRMDISWQGARKVVDKLVEAGVLRETTGRVRNRIYVAQELLDALESDIPADA